MWNSQIFVNRAIKHTHYVSRDKESIYQIVGGKITEKRTKNKEDAGDKYESIWTHTEYAAYIAFVGRAINEHNL